MESNSYIDVYVIQNSTFNKGKEKNIQSNKIKLNMSLKEVLISVFIMIISTIISLFIDFAGFREANIIMVFILGVIIVNIKTRGYILGFICSIVSIFLFYFLFYLANLYVTYTIILFIYKFC